MTAPSTRAQVRLPAALISLAATTPAISVGAGLRTLSSSRPS
jgi:hypothetical protein